MAPVYEVELKTRTDHGPVRRRLEEQGATYEGAVTQRDTYYDAPHRDFAATDEALRVREEHEDESETTRLTYKGPLVDPRGARNGGRCCSGAPGYPRRSWI